MMAKLQSSQKTFKQFADKQKASVKQEETLIFYQHRSQVYVLFLRFLAIFF